MVRVRSGALPLYFVVRSPEHPLEAEKPNGARGGKFLDLPLPLSSGNSGDCEAPSLLEAVPLSFVSFDVVPFPLPLL